MDLSEYVSVKEYMNNLKTVSDINTVKPVEFATVIGAVLTQHKNILVRDYLDVDGTFSVVFDMNFLHEPKPILDLYQSIREVVTDCLFTTIHNEGLVELNQTQGFWIQLVI